MTQLLIDLSDDYRKYVEARATDNGFPTPSAYVADLLRRDRDSEEDGPDAYTEEMHARIRANGEALKARDPAEYNRQVAHVHQMIRDGINSGPAVEMTDEDWGDIRQNVRDQLAAEVVR